MGAPTFWEDNRRAQELIRERTEISRLVTRTKELAGQAEDLGVMLELAAEHEDHGLDKDIVDGVARLRAAVDEFELKLMLSGPHDGKAAILSIHPGAGGTESQDWAQMLMRMYLRWCERNGFKAEVVDLLPGEEAGVKSVTTEVTGEKKEIAFGSQIRTYTFHPYQLVKDHRTSVEVGNVEGVMDGDIDDFIRASLMANKGAPA